MRCISSLCSLRAAALGLALVSTLLVLPAAEPAAEPKLPIRIKTGVTAPLKDEAGIQSGEQLRQRGAGMSVLNGRGRGDLVARVLVETPTRLNSKQKKILEEFRETETGDECPASKGFFSRIRDML